MTNWNDEMQRHFLATSDYNLRATGRTGRMLLEAVLKASEGYDVLVAAYSGDYVRTLYRQTRVITQGAFGLEVGTETCIEIGEGSITFTSYDRVDDFTVRTRRGKKYWIMNDHFTGNK